MAVSEWSEDWEVYHEHGLGSLIESGRVLPELFTYVGSDGSRILAAFPSRGDSLWRHWLNGRLMAGVGAEVLLRGLCLKRGFSLREPATSSDPLARRGSPEEQGLRADRHVSLGLLLKEHNQALVGHGPGLGNALSVAGGWRDSPAHIVPHATVDSGIDYVKLGMALRILHTELLEAASPDHVATSTTLLETTRSLFPSTSNP